MLIRSQLSQPVETLAHPPYAEEASSRARLSQDTPGTVAVPQRLARAGLFWSAEGMAAPTGPFASTGRHVAAAEWTRAVAWHGSIPTVDIFAPIAEFDRCQERIFSMIQGGLILSARSRRGSASALALRSLAPGAASGSPRSLDPPANERS
jgi:hypothetical protein